MRSRAHKDAGSYKATASVTRTGFVDTQIDLYCMATGNAMDNRRAAQIGGFAPLPAAASGDWA